MDSAGVGSNHTPNPPSIELAYKKKCIQLKKRLNEIEAENDLIRARNKRAKYYVAKMRLETCIMLERLATVTGMLEEAGVTAGAASSAAATQNSVGAVAGAKINAELRAKAAALVTSAHAQNNHEALDDETEGSSEEQPPTPQERPLRVKRSRKSNIAFEDIEAEAAMQYEANSPERGADDESHHGRHHGGSESRNIDGLAGDDERHDEENRNDRTPSQGADSRERAYLSAGTSGEHRRSSGFRAVNSRVDNQSAVPMDVDEKSTRSDS